MGWSDDDISKLPEAYRRQIAQKVGKSLPRQGGKSHNNAQKTVDENQEKVDSKLEAKHRAQLRLFLRQDIIRAYAPQFEIHLGGGVTMRIDHAVMMNDGGWIYLDSKGRKLYEWTQKQKQAKARGFVVVTVEQGESIATKLGLII